AQPRPPLPKTPAGPPTESIVESMLGTASASATTSASEGNERIPHISATSHQMSDASDSSGYWVTAFGFHSAAMVPAVLLELRPSGGDIMQHRLGAGTWMHVQLRSRTDQMEAIAKNGRVILSCKVHASDA
ncbi:MAG: hypothetical protein SGPRY_000928, partial [Prymnesium sp.]